MLKKDKKRQKNNQNKINTKNRIKYTSAPAFLNARTYAKQKINLT